MGAVSFYSTFQPPALKSLSHHLTFQEIHQMGLTSKIGRKKAVHMIYQKILHDFHEEALPVNRLLGTKNLSALYRILQCTRSIYRERIACLNFTEMMIDRELLQKILPLCPKIMRLRFNTDDEISYDLLSEVLSLPHITRLEIPGKAVDAFPEDQRHQIYGVFLSPKHNDELNELIDQLKADFHKITTLRIISQGITHLPRLPRTITHLTCSDCPIEKLHSFPRHLEYFDGRNCPLTELPKCPPSLKTILLQGCPIQQAPDVANDCSVFY